MLDNFVHIMTTAASGCIVALFAHWLHWLRNRNDKKK
ncbi:type I toxin-antitoxin system Fst family toxin [Staphylococcus haemolyticus]|nr:type I toxin-antitoxin system Fst family toxin [Staphylococcus haemolyticus]